METLSSSSSSAVLKALCTVKNIFSKGSGQEEKLWKDGTLDVLVTNLAGTWRAETFLNCADVAHSIIANCLVDVNIRLQCVKLDLISSLVWWLQFEKSTCSLLFRVLRCLTNLSGFEIDDKLRSSDGTGSSLQAQYLLSSKECLKVVLNHSDLMKHTCALLGQHSGHRRCVFGLCKLLTVFVKEAPWSRHHLKSNQAVFTALVAGMSSTSSDVVKAALWCVETCMSVDLGLAKSLAEAGGIPVVVKLAEHSHSKIRQRAVLTLVHCLWDSSCRFAFGGCHGIKVLLHHMQSAGYDSRKRVALVKAIAVSCQDVICRENAREEGALMVLLEMLAARHYSSLHRTILQCLLYFYFDEASLVYMASKLSLPTILANRIIAYHLHVRGKPLCAVDDCFYPHLTAEKSAVSESSSEEEERVFKSQSPSNVDNPPVDAAAIDVSSATKLCLCDGAEIVKSESVSISPIDQMVDEDLSSTLVLPIRSQQQHDAVPGNIMDPADHLCVVVAGGDVQGLSYTEPDSVTISTMPVPDCSLACEGKGGEDGHSSKEVEPGGCHDSPFCDSTSVTLLSQAFSAQCGGAMNSPSLPPVQHTVSACALSTQSCQVLSLASCPSPVHVECLSPAMSPLSSCGLSPQPGSFSPAHNSPALLDYPSSPVSMPTTAETASSQCTGPAGCEPDFNNGVSPSADSAEGQGLPHEASDYYQSLHRAWACCSPQSEKSGRLFGAGLSRFAQGRSSESGGESFHAEHLPQARPNRTVLPPVRIPDSGPLTSPVPAMQIPPSSPQNPPLSPLFPPNEPFDDWPVQSDSALSSSCQAGASLTSKPYQQSTSVAPESTGSSRSEQKLLDRPDDVNMEVYLLDRLSQLPDCNLLLGNRLVVQCLVAHLVAGAGRLKRTALRTLSRIVSDVRCFERCIQQQVVFVLYRLRCDAVHCPLRGGRCSCDVDNSLTLSSLNDLAKPGWNALCCIGQLLCRQLAGVGQSDYGRGVMERELLLNKATSVSADNSLLSLPLVVRHRAILRQLLARAGGVAAFFRLLHCAKQQTSDEDIAMTCACDLQGCLPSSTASPDRSTGRAPVGQGHDHPLPRVHFQERPEKDSTEGEVPKSGAEKYACHVFAECKPCDLQLISLSLAHLFAHYLLKTSPLEFSGSCERPEVLSKKRKHSVDSDGVHLKSAKVHGSDSASVSTLSDTSREEDGSRLASLCWSGCGMSLSVSEGSSQADHHHMSSLCTLPCCALLSDVLLCCSVGYYKCRYDTAVRGGGADVLFVLADGQLLPAHRSTLGQQSDVMYAMVYGSFAEANSTAQISMKGVSPLAVICMLHVMYGCELTGCAGAGGTAKSNPQLPASADAPTTSTTHGSPVCDCDVRAVDDNTHRMDGGVDDGGGGSVAITDFCVGSGKVCWSGQSVHNDALCLLLQTLATARQYLMTHLTALSSRALVRHICAHNVSELFQFACGHDMKSLAQSCLHFMGSCSVRDWLLIFNSMSKESMELDIDGLWSCLSSHLAI